MRCDAQTLLLPADLAGKPCLLSIHAIILQQQVDQGSLGALVCGLESQQGALDYLRGRAVRRV
jgi:hypothetical protein